MTLGSLLVLGPDHGDAALRTLLGAPIALRALAATLSVPDEVRAVAVAPRSIHERLRAEADRFGLTELVDILDAAATQSLALKVGLAALGDVELVLVQDGLHAATPTALVHALVAAARTHGCAVPARTVTAPVFATGESLKEALPGNVLVPHLPLAGKPDALARAAGSSHASIVAALVEAGVEPRVVPGDEDVRPVVDEADLHRALEAWGRRAPDYAFIWPRPSIPVADAPSPPPATPNITLVDPPA